jgi:DNA-binding transcriptional MerR regulator
MLSIGEFARLGAVSVRTQRHYDEIGVLRPAQVDPETGYRCYSADQLRQLSRIIALKELGLSLAQTRRMIDGITVEELRGMLMLRRAQLELDIESQANQLRGVEARLRHIDKEGAMPADDIKAKIISAMGVVAIAEHVTELGPLTVVPAVNRAAAQFDHLVIRERVEACGPLMFFYETDHGDADGATVYLACRSPGSQPSCRNRRGM